MRILKPLPGILPMPGHPRADAVGLWPMNSLGNRIFDLSGNGNTGTITGAVWSAGKFGSALDFDGGIDVVNAGSGISIDNIFDGGGTISFWFYPRSDGGGNFGQILSKRGAGLGWQLNLREEVASVVKLQFLVDFDGFFGDWHTTNAVLTINQCNHIAVTYNSDSAGNDPIIYANSISVAIIEDDTPVGTRNTDAAHDLLIGNNLAVNRGSDGLIDVLNLYNRILSASEIALLYREPFCMYPENIMPEFAISA